MILFHVFHQEFQLSDAFYSLKQIYIVYFFFSSQLSITNEVNVINVFSLAGKLDVILLFCRGSLFLFPGIPFNKRSLFSS